MTSLPKIAVVIPYYKRDFFEALLAALVAQTDPRFVVYVGDDCSPQPAAPIVAQYASQLTITSHRFDTNMGGRDLAGQWNRCLELLDPETDWVWVLPDDDLPAPNCIAEIHAAIAAVEPASAPGVLHMPVHVTTDPQTDLDANRHGGLCAETPRWSLQDNLSYYSDFLRHKGDESEGITLGNVIYNRARLETRGGFVSFPSGWGSDHATALLCAQPGGILRLTQTYLLFRQSGQNISSQQGDGALKMAGRVAFAQWLRANPQAFEQPLSPEFFQWFYWKGEFFALHVWKLTPEMLRGLWRLHGLCFPGAGRMARLRALAVVIRGQLAAKIPRRTPSV